MDEEIKPLLQDIAAELRARNELMRDQQKKADEMRSELLSRSPFGSSPGKLPDVESIMAKSREGMKSYEDRMDQLRQDSERDRAERREFQQALLTEIKRLNENLEHLIAPKGS